MTRNSWEDWKRGGRAVADCEEEVASLDGIQYGRGRQTCADLHNAGFVTCQLPNVVAEFRGKLGEELELSFCTKHSWCFLRMRVWRGLAWGSWRLMMVVEVSSAQSFVHCTWRSYRHWKSSSGGAGICSWGCLVWRWRWHGRTSRLGHMSSLFSLQD